MNMISELKLLLIDNRVASGIIRASYYETSERHKGANEGGQGWRRAGREAAGGGRGGP